MARVVNTTSPSFAQTAVAGEGTRAPGDDMGAGRRHQTLSATTPIMRARAVSEEKRRIDAETVDPLSADAETAQERNATSADAVEGQVLAQATTSASQDVAASSAAGTTPAASAAAAGVGGGLVGAMLVTLGLAAAGGGGGGGGGGTSSSKVTIQGKVIDGYLAGADLFVDANRNGQKDAGEPSTVTDAQGNFTLQTDVSGPLVATGGTDLSTGLPFVGVLKAPAGSTVVTPLTTLVAEIVEQTDVNVAEAQTTVFKATGLSALDGQIDLSSFDPVAAAAGSDAAAQATALQVQKAAVVVMTLVSKLTDQVREDAGAGEGARDEIAGAIFAQLIDQISASPQALEGSLTAASIDSTATALVTKLSQAAELGGVTVDGDKLLEARTAITESVSGLAQQLETATSIDDLGDAQKETLTSTTYTLQLLHFADAEAGMLASQTAPRLAALVDRFEDAYANSIT
ncbi:MAG: hypothetical protein RLZ83_902, partial [Pseudomonadota bacterium]